MTPKERAVMQQALEALEELFHSNSTKVAVEKYNIAHNALRESLAEQVEQEPVAWRECSFCGVEHQIKSDGYILDTKTDEVFCRKCYVHTHEQEPVAWVGKGGFNTCGEGQSLYAAPVRTKDLTDDEVVEVMETWGTAFMNLNPDTAPDPDVYIARAVIAADREKNK